MGARVRVRVPRHPPARDVRVGPRPLGRAGRAHGAPRGLGARRARTRDAPTTSAAFTHDNAHRLWGAETVRGTRWWPADDAIVWRTATVASGGEEIYYEVTGDDERPRSCSATAPAVRTRHGSSRCPSSPTPATGSITWDCRGFGQSTFTTGVLGPRPRPPTTSRPCSPPPAPTASTCAGQSMGGWWVTAFTLANPHRVRSLTLSNTVGGLWTDALDAHFPRFVVDAGAAGICRLGDPRSPQPGVRRARPRARLPLSTAEHVPLATDGRHRDRASSQRPCRARRSRRARHPDPRDHRLRRQLFPAPLVTDSAAAARERHARRDRRTPATPRTSNGRTSTTPPSSDSSRNIR